MASTISEALQLPNTRVSYTNIPKLKNEELHECFKEGKVNELRKKTKLKLKF